MLKSALKLAAAAAMLVATASAASADVVARYEITNNTGFRLSLDTARCSGGGSISPPFFVQSGEKVTFQGTSPADSSYCNVRYEYTDYSNWTQYGCQFQVMTSGYASTNAYKGKNGMPNCTKKDEGKIQNGYEGQFVMN